MSSLCTTAEVKTHAGIAGSSFDSMLDQMILQVDGVVKAQTGTFVADDAGGDTITSEVIDGKGGRYLRVDYWPIVSVTTVETRDADFTWDSYTQEAVGDMETKRNRIYTQYVVNGAGERNIRVTYEAGIDPASIPEDINLCAILMVLRLFTQRNSQGLQNQSVLGLTIQLSDDDDKYIARTLKKYERVFVA
jgi:hypothetical protein